MKILRKAATAEWNSENVKEFEDLKLPTEPWTRSIAVTFDATKDDKAERRTVVKLVISETEIERLYVSLQAGRQKQQRELRRNAAKAAKLFFKKVDVASLTVIEKDVISSLL